MTSFKRSNCRLKLLLLYPELLIILHMALYLAVCYHLIDFHSDEFEKFMHVLVSLQHENAPTICCRVLFH